MRDDEIEAVLRDAGDDPTRSLDVAAVHGAGRRRTTRRRLAVGAAATAVVVGAVVLVPQLLPTDDVPVIGPAPSPSASPSPAPTDDPGPTPTGATPTGEAGPDDGAPTPPGTPAGSGTPTPSTVASVTGVGTPLVTVELLDGETFRPLGVTRTAPDGEVVEYTTATGAATEAAVDGAGRVVYVDGDGTLTRADAASTAPVRSDEEGPWSVLGPTPAGDTFVTRGRTQELWVLTDTDVVRHGSRAAVDQPETTIVRATSDGARTLVVQAYAGEGGTDWVLHEGGSSEVVHRQGTIGFPQDDETDFRRFATYVDGQLWWVLQRGEEEPRADLQFARPDGTLAGVPTPIGRDLGGFVDEVSVGALPDGRPALLLDVVEGPRRAPLPPVLVDVEAARAAATPGSTDEVPDGVFTVLDQPGGTVFEP